MLITLGAIFNKKVMKDCNRLMQSQKNSCQSEQNQVIEIGKRAKKAF